MAQCYKCSVQIKKYDEKNPKIKCQGCFREICGKCSELTATELRVFSLTNPKLSYLCQDCQEGLKQVPAMRKLVSELQQQVQDLKTQQSKGIDVELIIREVQERQNRSCNVIAFGIPESKSTSVEERKNHDKKEIVKAFETVPNCDVGDITTIRLGKFDCNKARPLKILMRSKSSAVSVLRNKNLLPTGIKVKSDLTPYQRDHLTKLRAELDERTNQGEKDLTIKYVNNLPKIVNNTKN